jgi:hypothetical protein
MRIVMTLVAATAAGYLFDRFDVPGGTIIGRWSVPPPTR